MFQVSKGCGVMKMDLIITLFILIILIIISSLSVVFNIMWRREVKSGFCKKCGNPLKFAFIDSQGGRTFRCTYCDRNITV